MFYFIIKKNVVLPNRTLHVLCETCKTPVNFSVIYIHVDHRILNRRLILLILYNSYIFWFIIAKVNYLGEKLCKNVIFYPVRVNPMWGKEIKEP